MIILVSTFYNKIKWFILKGNVFCEDGWTVKRFLIEQQIATLKIQSVHH